MSKLYCLQCFFLLETAVICRYWYVFGVSLKSAPRYVNAMRTGRKIANKMNTSINNMLFCAIYTECICENV